MREGRQASYTTAVVRWLVCGAIIMGTAECAAGRWRRGEREEEQAAPVDTTVSAPSSAALGAGGRTLPPATFIDTLNAGREAKLTEADLEPPRSSPPVAPGGATQAAPRSGATLVTAPQAQAGEVFRIQCMASTQMDALQDAKKALESKSSYPVMVFANPPYFKLLVGEFSSRQDAERALYDIKGLGYPDAWIVKGLPTTPR
jgi:septal ring-binding cell division protein DamX